MPTATTITTTTPTTTNNHIHPKQPPHQQFPQLLQAPPEEISDVEKIPFGCWKNSNLIDAEKTPGAEKTPFEC